MNIFITSTSLLSICLFSSCATIKGFRGDPDSWGKKDKKANIKEVEKKAALPTQRVVAPTSTSQVSPTANNQVNKLSNKKANKGRHIPGFMEPNVTELPDNKDLQESNNVAPAPAPVTPKLETPSAPLLPIAPEIAPELADPTDALPPIE